MWYSIKYFLRTIQKRRTISAITIGGYAISLAVLFVLVSFIISEKNINRGFVNLENIYRIKRTENPDNEFRSFMGNMYALIDGQAAQTINGEINVPQTLLEDLKTKVPGIRKASIFLINSVMYEFNGQRSPGVFMATNDEFLDVFSFQFLYQVQDPSLEVKDHAILTKSFSERLFGPDNPVGEYFTIENRTYTIVGVVNDAPENSSFRFDAMISIEEAPFRSGIGYNDEMHNMFNCMVLLNGQANPSDVEDQISGMISHWQAFANERLFLQPFREVYFDSSARDGLQHANVAMIYLLSCISVIILLMTIFNYGNLTISRGYERLNEISIKKATGASRNTIFGQFITESIVTSFIATAIAICLAVFLAPLFSGILGKDIEIMTLLAQPVIAAVILAIVVVVGIVSGLFPAMRVSGVTPAKIFSHSQSIGFGKNKWVMVVFQFCITIVLIVSVFFVFKQLQYAKKTDLGFDQEMMLRLSLDRGSMQKWNPIRDELLRNPSVLYVSASFGNPFSIYSSASGTDNGSGGTKIENMSVIGCDEDFIPAFSLSLIQGRNFEISDSNVCIINEHLYKHLGWDDLTGRTVFGNKVIGVIEDFHYQNLYNEIGHLQLSKLNTSPTALNIKFTGDIGSMLAYVETTLHDIDPAFQMNYDFYDEFVRSMYQKEEAQIHALKIFTALAIVISCLGLIGLVELMTNKKIKEIGIRKVNGARISEVMVMLNKDFVKWVGIAFVIATPIAYYAMNKWLQNFAYRTGLSWWIFGLAGLLALGIALLTVSWQSWRAASRNPVEALRYE